MKKHFCLAMLFLVNFSLSAQNQYQDNPESKFYLGSTMFMLYNLLDDPEPPKVYQLHFGYRLTPKDVVSLELITWKYYEPIGVPYAEKKTAPNFPGSVQDIGAGLAYKRFLWKKVYAQVHATAFHQRYLDESGKEIQSGFQLFNTVRLGYQLRLFNNRFFIEPSIAMTFWPINTNLPPAFQIEEDKWNKYFLGEPGLHFGFNF